MRAPKVLRVYNKLDWLIDWFFKNALPNAAL